MIMYEELAQGTPFREDLYLYDLDQMEMPPLAYRSARGGQAQPDLISLLDLPARAWHDIANKLHCSAVYLSANGGAVLLPVQGGIGRFVAVVKTQLSLAALAYLAQCAGQGKADADEQIRKAVPNLDAKEYEAAQSAARTVARLRLLMDACERANGALEAEACVQSAADLLGVSLMPQERAEFLSIQEFEGLPEMQHSGQVLFVCTLTLLSTMRNLAHARSGWLCAQPCEGGYVLQAFLRCDASVDREALARLRALLEQNGIALGARSCALPIKPPRQYAYMSRKITDPRKPLCARCQCLDARCATCTAVQWVVLPYVCDAALLGIKTFPDFES